MSTSDFIKPIAMGACVVAADKYLLGETDMNRSLYFGAAGAVGVYAAKLVAPLVPLETFLPDGTYTNASTLELRLFEVGVSTGVGFVVNKFILKNELYIDQELKKIAVLAGADFVSEYIDDYMNNRALSFFR